MPPLERLIESLEATVAAHPATRFIGAHVAGLAEDLTRADQLLQDYDNLWIDVGARLSELGRQPRATRRLIERHPDRVLFASDVVPPKATDYALWLRFLETDDEAFPYTATDPPPAGRWTISGLGLPRDLLQRVYRDNALAVLGETRPQQLASGERIAVGRQQRAAAASQPRSSRSRERGSPESAQHSTVRSIVEGDRPAIDIADLVDETVDVVLAGRSGGSGDERHAT